MIREFEGKTEKEAIDKAVEELGIDREEFDVEIIKNAKIEKITSIIGKRLISKVSSASLMGRIFLCPLMITTIQQF